MRPTLCPRSHPCPVRPSSSLFAVSSVLIVHLIDNPYAMPVSSSGYHPQSQPYGGGGGVPFYNPYSLHPPPEMAYMMQGPPMNMNMNMNMGYPHHQHTISSSAAPFYPSSAPFQSPQSKPSSAPHHGDNLRRYPEESSPAPPPPVDANK